MSDLWRRCLERLEGDLSAEDLHTWLMPLQARDDADGLQLFAPNSYTRDTVRERYLEQIEAVLLQLLDRKSTRLNSSHDCISYAVFCLKKKK